MCRLRNKTKTELLWELFRDPEMIGKRISMEEVMDVTKIPTRNSLTTYFTYFRKSPHVKEKNRLDIRTEGENCYRAK